MGDCVEALIGAVYLDGGLKSAEIFVLNFWKQYLDVILRFSKKIKVNSKDN